MTAEKHRKREEERQATQPRNVTGELERRKKEEREEKRKGKEGKRMV